MTDRYTARSVSDSTDDWPFWMAWNGHVNVTARVFEALTGRSAFGCPFMRRQDAEALARQANEKGLTI